MIVCAALRLKNNPEVVFGGVRYGSIYYSSIRAAKLDVGINDVEEGFLDEDGFFHNRYDSLIIANQCGQISATTWAYKQNQGEKELFSEDLY